MAINASTDTIPWADVHAALTALGIPEEQFKVISEVTIAPFEVTIRVFETDDKGHFKILHTNLGNVAAMGIRTYKIDKGNG